METDLWVFDVAAETFINLTDDGLTGSAFDLPDETRAPLDYLPVWHPNSREVFFFRVIRQEGVTLGEFALYRVAVDGGEAQLVRDLTPELPAFSVYGAGFSHLRGPVGISPDGEQLAMIASTVGLQATVDGVWVMATSGAAPPRRLLGLDAFTGAPAEMEAPPGIFQPWGLAWSADGQGLFVAAQTPPGRERFYVSIPYYVDIASGAMTPMLDFTDVSLSDLNSREALGGHSPAFAMPRSSILLPTSDTLLVLNRELDGTAGVSALQWTGEGWTQTLLYEADLDPRLGNPSSVSGDGSRLLLAGYLFTQD
jgi:hypothetical protein